MSSRDSRRLAAGDGADRRHPRPGQRQRSAEALRAGAHEIVILPAEAPVVATRSTRRWPASSTAPLAAATAPRSPLVAVLGPKGGVGKTTVSHEPGDRPGRHRQSAAAGRPRPPVRRRRPRPRRRARAHDLRPRDRRGQRSTASGCAATSARSADGVDVLLAPVRPDQAEAVTRRAAGGGPRRRPAEYDVVVVDTPPGVHGGGDRRRRPGDRMRSCVGSLDLPGLKNMKVGIETLRLMDVPRDRHDGVSTGPTPRSASIADDVKAILGRAPDVNVPSDRCVAPEPERRPPIVTSEPKSRPAQGAPRARRARREAISSRTKEE